MFIFYIIGIISTVFHFANGLWSFFVSWGITVSPVHNIISTYFTIGVFVGIDYSVFVAIRTFLAFCINKVILD